MYDNLATVTHDCVAIRKALAKYNIKNEGPDLAKDDITKEEPDYLYRMVDSTWSRWRNVKTHISKSCTAQPDKGHFVFSCFAGHG